MDDIDPREEKIALNHMLANQLMRLYGTGNSQQVFQSARERLKGNEFFNATGRIRAGGTGDIAQLDDRGNITGYKDRPPDAGGGLAPGAKILPFKNASRSPGLDKFHTMQEGAGGGPHSWDAPYSSAPASVAATGDDEMGSVSAPAQSSTGRVFNQQSSIRPLPRPEAGGLVNRVSFPNGINPRATGGEGASTWGAIQSGNANLYLPADTRRVEPAAMVKPPTWNQNGWNTTGQREIRDIASKYRTLGSGFASTVDTADYVNGIFS